MTETRPFHRDPLVWAYLGLLILILGVTLRLLGDSMWFQRELRRVKGQNQWSIEDRDYLHQELQQTRDQLHEQGRILRRADEVIKAEEERQQRRRREEQQKAQPRPQSMQDMPPQTTTLTVTKVIADELAKRPDFVSMQSTYGPEDLWIVVLCGNPDLTARHNK